jgi:hypothetical protein
MLVTRTKNALSVEVANLVLAKKLPELDTFRRHRCDSRDRFEKSDI